GIAPVTLGGDKGYHAGEFVRDLRERKITPHIAMVNGRKTPGLRLTLHGLEPESRETPDRRPA
ncbi:hypothetical protein MNBD_NITROSPINAE04-2366, partial [hydrothermal vent metagenome]